MERRAADVKLQERAALLLVNAPLFTKAFTDTRGTAVIDAELRKLEAELARLEAGKAAAAAQQQQQQQQPWVRWRKQDVEYQATLKILVRREGERLHQLVADTIGEVKVLQQQASQLGARSAATTKLNKRVSTAMGKVRAMMEQMNGWHAAGGGTGAIITEEMVNAWLAEDVELYDVPGLGGR